MTSRTLDKANQFYAAAMKNIKFLLLTAGTDFVVLRPKNNSKWKQVFGGAYSSDSTLEQDYEQFTIKLIINQNDLKDVWNRNRDNLESYSNDGSLEVGDELQYTRNKRTFRFKVFQKMAYSEAADVFYVYNLSTMVETLDM